MEFGADGYLAYISVSYNVTMSSVSYNEHYLYLQSVFQSSTQMSNGANCQAHLMYSYNANL